MDDTLATNYLHKRGSRYYFRRKIPLDLLPHYQGRKEIVKALGTSEPAKARELVREESYRSDQEFAALRQPSVDAPQTVELREFIVDPVTSESVPSGRTVTLDLLRPGRYDLATTEGERIAHLWPTGDKDAYHKRRLKDARAFVAAMLVARATGSIASPEIPHAISNAPKAPPPAGGPSADHLAALAEAWAKERKPVPRSVAMMDRTIAGFYEHVGRIPVAQITKAHVISLKDALLSSGTSPATTDLRLAMLRTLFNYGEANLKLESNPARGVKVGARKNQREARLPFDLAALRAIFSSPVYSKGERPVSGRGEAAYWIPLLALFSGARLEEIGQIAPEDVCEEVYYDPSGNAHTAWVMRISNRGDEQGVKNASSARRVPIHAEIIARGFLEFAEDTRGHGRVFDLSPDSYGVETGKWGSWFSTYLREVCKVTDSRMSFHSFRHLFKDTCRALLISEDVHDALTGHASGKVSRRVYGGLTYPLGPLVDAVARYKVHGLALPDSPASFAENSRKAPR